MLLAYTMSAGLLAAARRPFSQLALIKRQQKIERRQLSIQEKIWKGSLRGRRIPRAERLAEKHQYQRNMRNLRLRQKNQIQQLEDQRRLQKYMATHSAY